MRDQVLKSIVNSALLDSSIYLLLGDLGVFQAKHGIDKVPQQIFNYGIREQSMISFATGISLAQGYPFLYSINPFINDRAVEQIKNGPSYNNTPLCIVTAGGTCDYYKLGKTHFCVNDVNNLISHDVPYIFLPFDENEAETFVNHSIKHRLYSYIRLSSQSIHNVRTNEISGCRKQVLRVYIGPDSLIYKPISDLNCNNYYLSVISKDSIDQLLDEVIWYEEVEIYAPFNASNLYIKLFNLLSSFDKRNGYLAIRAHHVPTIPHKDIKPKADLLLESTKTLHICI